jgi:hypothetical protein
MNNGFPEAREKGSTRQRLKELRLANFECAIARFNGEACL